MSESKWILAVGSGHDLPPKLIDTSKRLGASLADAGFGLITEGWPDVDHLVAYAVAESVKQANLRLAHRLLKFMSKQRIPDFPAGDLITTASDTEAKERSVNKADVVVPIIADPSEKFALKKHIQEAQAKMRELAG